MKLDYVYNGWNRPVMQWVFHDCAEWRLFYIGGDNWNGVAEVVWEIASIFRCKFIDGYLKWDFYNSFIGSYDGILYRELNTNWIYDRKFLSNAHKFGGFNLLIACWWTQWIFNRTNVKFKFIFSLYANTVRIIKYSNTKKLKLHIHIWKKNINEPRVCA